MRDRLTIVADGITVSCDGPIEALHAVQRDAIGVRFLDPDEDDPAAFVAVVEWAREQRRKRAA